jgi:hypothetical protein
MQTGVHARGGGYMHADWSACERRRIHACRLECMREDQILGSMDIETDMDMDIHADRYRYDMHTHVYVRV